MEEMEEMGGPPGPAPFTRSPIDPSIRAAKTDLRCRMAALRDAIPPDERDAAGQAIRERLLGMPEWGAARVVFLYVSFRSEVSTEGILSAALEEGRTVLVPKVDRERREIDAWHIRSHANLAPGAWGILEPSGPGVRITEPGDIDLVLAPGLAFDRRGGRLGYGAGYYDRYLRRTRADCRRVGLAYEVQVLPEVPVGPDDALVHAVATEVAVYRVAR